MWSLLIVEPDTRWLMLTNYVLGAVVLICCLVVAGGIADELIARWKLRREVNNLDHEVSELVTNYRALTPDDHSFHSPDLGITMADGGERLDPKDKKR